MRIPTPAATATAAFVLFAAACAVFGGLSPDFGHLRHPLSLLGALGEPNAAAFNLSAFIVPGLLLAWLAWRWRGALEAGSWRARIGLQLLLLAALAFAAQGALPLDPTDLAAPASRLHAAAWSAWWIAFAAGALVAGVGGAGGRALAGVVLLLALAGASVLPAPLVQRLAFAGWFGWWLWAARTPPLSRGGSSTRG